MKSLKCFSKTRIFFSVLVALVLLSAPLSAETFTVVNTSDSGEGSLRQAILDANELPGKDTIAFGIPGEGPHTIQPLSDFPWIEDPVILDGSTQPGADCSCWPPTLMIEIDGNYSGAFVGIGITAGNSTIKGLVVNRFPEYGIGLAYGDDNVIQCCFVGTDVTGLQALGNGVGIVTGLDAENNLIGGATEEKRNLVSGNNWDGMWLQSSKNRVVGNFIGTDITGTSALPNFGSGLVVEKEADDHVIGGSVPGEGNVISANGNRGLWLLSSNNVVKGNFIGTDVTGTVALGNADVGLAVNWEGEFNTIGGTTPGERNLICDSGHFGVWILGSNNTVSGNFIGVDVTGMNALGNGWSGLEIHGGSSNNTIGGSVRGAGNLISGNKGHGVGMYHEGTSGNVVQGNLIGTNIFGTPCLGNGQKGVDIESGASDNLIGGLTRHAGNVIADNGRCGINFWGEGTCNNTVVGNVVTDNKEHGIGVFGGASNNKIGGTEKGAGNLVSNNGVHGIVVHNEGTSFNVIQGNKVGTDIFGRPVMGNGEIGVDIAFGACNNLVGGECKEAANVIAGNGANGIQIFGDGTLNNRVQGNSIFTNDGLGIDLWGDGVTDNDPGDTDDGPNHLQNFPLLNTVVNNGGTLVLHGVMDTQNPENVTVEIFINGAIDESGYGEGMKSLCTTSPDENGVITAELPAVPTGAFLTATSIDADGNTSEFSAALLVTDGMAKELVDETETLPTEYSLSQNFPNPFNPETTIEFQLPDECDVKLIIYNLLGEQIRVLDDKHYDAGIYALKWDAHNDFGQPVPSGVYIYRLQAGDFSQTLKMSLLR